MWLAGQNWLQGRGTIEGSPDDYLVRDTEQGEFVENERAGLRVKVPDGWTVEKIDVMEGSMVFYSPDAQGVRPGRIRPPLEKGCIIETAVAYKKTDFEEIKREIKEVHQDLVVKLDEIEMVEVNGKQVLKNNFESIELGPSVNLYYVLEDKFYGFSVYATPGEIEKCSQEFERFLETVSIK